MNSRDVATHRICAIALLILITSVGAFGCGEDEKVKVNANNFADLAAASAEVARGAYVSEEILLGLVGHAFETFLTPAVETEEVTYRYTGNPYTTASRVYEGKSLYISMTMSEVIPPDVSNFTPTVTDFSMTGGLETIGPGDPDFRVNRFSTNSSGEITEWAVDVRTPGNFHIIRTCNTGTTISDTSHGADPDRCAAGDDVNDRVRKGNAGTVSGRNDDAAGTWSADPICDAGTASFTEDESSSGRYEIAYAGCVQVEEDETCTIDGTLVLRDGEVGGAPFTAEGVDLQVDCSSLGVLDLDATRLECAHAERDGEPVFDDDCTLDLSSIEGNVSGLEFGANEIDASGSGSAVEALGTFVDPDHGEFLFEAIGLDIDSCDWEVPYVGLIGGGVEENTAPAFLAIFADSCDEFTACYLETQDDIEAFGLVGVGGCTLTTSVQWAHVSRFCESLCSDAVACVDGISFGECMTACEQEQEEAWDLGGAACVAAHEVYLDCSISDICAGIGDADSLCRTAAIEGEIEPCGEFVGEF